MPYLRSRRLMSLRSLLFIIFLCQEFQPFIFYIFDVQLAEDILHPFIITLFSQLDQPVFGSIFIRRVEFIAFVMITFRPFPFAGMFRQNTQCMVCSGGTVS